MILSSALALNTAALFLFFSVLQFNSFFFFFCGTCEECDCVPSEISEINSQACFRALKNDSYAWPSQKQRAYLYSVCSMEKSRMLEMDL